MREIMRECPGDVLGYGKIITQTVRRSLKKARLKAVLKKKKLFLSKRHRKVRMDFVTTYLY
jgi:DDE superfamily endonuclease